MWEIVKYILMYLCVFILFLLNILKIKDVNFDGFLKGKNCL